MDSANPVTRKAGAQGLKLRAGTKSRQAKVPRTLAFPAGAA
ncbi:MAG: hypothetical protein WD740_06065 [Anaerolineales bacterium]